MSKFIQTHFFYSSTFPLPTKQKWEKLKYFLFLLFLPPTIFYLFTFSLFQPNEPLKLLMINLCGILVELTCFMYKQIYELLCHISHWIEQKTKAFNKFTFVWRHHRKTKSRWRWSGCRYSLKSAHLCGKALVKQI